MRRIPNALLILFLIGAFALTGCKYNRDADADASADELVDKAGKPLMPSEGEPVADKAKAKPVLAKAQPVKKLKKIPPGDPKRPTLAPPKLEDAKKPAAGDIPAPADVAAAPADAKKTATGLAYKVITKGTGAAHPTANDRVKVHYTGWTTDGKMFDSSKKRGQPAEFALGAVIPGWTEGVQLMVIGETTRFWIPEAQAYAGRPGAPAGMLVFDIELLEIKTAPKPSLALATPPADAQKTASGVVSKVIKAGTGTVHPSGSDIVNVDYSGWTTDGKMFDSSTLRGKAADIPMDKVIPGWSEGLALMVEGETRMMWIPEELAYKGRQGAPAGMLVFEVSLNSIKSAPKAPADVAAPPADAKKTASGLASKVLTKGTGTVHPTATTKVEVHYSGWTTDGKMFDSSVMRTKTSSFGLNAVIAGWTEGVQLMVEGEKRRFWIPEALAYKGQAGRPAGMLVFDIELVKIH